MKTDRIIGILSVIIQKGKVTVSELAEKFEVSPRTIARDIDAINLAGIPIVCVRGKGGGVSIMENYMIDKTLLTGSDMNYILAGLKALDSVSGTGCYRMLMEKLSADSSLADNNDAVIIDLSAWDKSAVSDKFELIKDAIYYHEKISFEYHSPKGDGVRVTEPYNIVYQWSGWYVRGYCTDREDYRLFKLNRMTSLRRTGEKFTVRDVPAYKCDKLRHIRGGIEARVRFSPSVKWRIIDEFGADFGEYDEHGNITADFTWEDIRGFFSYILTFGDAAEIISPKEYRTGFAELLKKISEKY